MTRVNLASYFAAGVLLLAPSAPGRGPVPAAKADAGTRLLRHPAVSRELVAFDYAGDIWVAPRDGGAARRLTATPDVETEPHFSPDGSLVAYTMTIGASSDVYVVPSSGGDPRRVTWHPALDRARGWSPDGKRILFASSRTSAPQQAFLRLWSVSVDGGLPDVLPMPRAFTGTYSPDGKRVAYEELSTQFVPAWEESSFWRHYRGGRTHPISLMRLGDYAVEKLPWTDSNDREPMWVGNTVYFISDRDYTANLYAYRTDTKELKRLTSHDDFDVMNASAGPGAIVYEQGGYVHLYDLERNQSRQLVIDVRADLPWARPQFKQVASMIRGASLSPTGVRAAFEARGDIFTVPAEKGDWRDLTRTTDAHESNPVWSPDGTRLAWFSDASGEYQLMIGDQAGLAKTRAIDLPGTAFYAELTWSPDGKHLAFTENHLGLWIVDAESGRATSADEETFADPGREMRPTWSPDSRWLAYSKSLDSHLRAIFMYSVADGKAHRVTDGMSDAISPSFDEKGKYLYFLASTDYGPRTGWLEMSALDRPVRRAIYLAVLPAGEPSPLLPESGDEPAVIAQVAQVAQAGRARRDTVGPSVDLAGIGQRILALPVPAGDYDDLTAGPAGSIFYTEAGANAGAPRKLMLHKITERAPTTFMEGVRSYTLSGDRKKLLYAAAGGGAARLGIVPTSKPARAGEGAIDVAQLQMWVDPRAEWAHIFHESWRIQGEYFYDAKMHGAPWNEVRRRYAEFLPYVGHRSDLGYLIAMTGGELVVGHSYLNGAGDMPGSGPVSVGLLGADLAVENGRYRIAHIYTGENWNPELRAPLSAPGIDVAEGDYLLEVNGRSLAAPANPYPLFEGTAGHQTVIRVSRTPDAGGSRLVTVVPVASEDGLRTRAWIERNRHIVDSLSRKRLAYVWLPNTGNPGYTAFTRYFYAQQEREGAIIDERYNQGGLVADYIVNELDRKPMGYFAQRDGKVVTSPAAGIFGPKVMLINESAGSGGDALPYYFKLRKIGPLVGTRTWGGLVGTLGTAPTIDGGAITAPSLAFYDLAGRWAVENEGVTPDIPVEYSAREVIRGHDPQLERAVQEALALLANSKPPRVPRPAPIDRVKR